MALRRKSFIAALALLGSLVVGTPAQANTITGVTIVGTPSVGSTLVASVSGGATNYWTFWFACNRRLNVGENPAFNLACVTIAGGKTHEDVNYLVVPPRAQGRFIQVIVSARNGVTLSDDLTNTLAQTDVIVPVTYDAPAVINASGGTTATNGLRITYAGGQIQINRNGSGQVFRPGTLPSVASNSNETHLFNGLYLLVGSTIVGPQGAIPYDCVDRTIPGVLKNSTGVKPDCPLSYAKWDSVTSTGGSAAGSGTITSRLSYRGAQGTYTVDLTLSYVANNDFYSYRAVVTPPASNTQQVKLYQIVDTYLIGSDAGPGFYVSGAQPMVGTEKTFDGVTVVEALRNTGRAWDGYWSGYYLCPFLGSHVTDSYNKNECKDLKATARSGGDLMTGSAAIDTRETTDNGMAAVWKLGAAKTATTINYDLVFSGTPTSFPPTINNHIVTGGNDAGGIVTWDALLGGTPNVTSTQQWYRCTSPVTAGITVPAGCTAIASATEKTYVETAADAGRYVTAFVTARNAFGTATSIAPRTIATVIPEILFPNPADHLVGATGVSVTASVTGGGAVTFTSTTPTVCTVATTSGSATVQLHSAGQCSITASSNRAQSITRTFNVTKHPQTITFSQPDDVEISTGSVALSATATSGLAVTYTTKDSWICTVSGSTVTLVSTGRCELFANQAGNVTFDSAPTVTRFFSVIQKPVITNAAVTGNDSEGSRLTRTATVTGTPTATVTEQWYRCLNPVVAGTTVPAGCAEIAGETGTSYVTGPADVGRYVTSFITATNSAGRATAICPKSTPVANREIVFPDLIDRPVTATGVTASATASGLPVTFTSATPDVCTTTSGGQITLKLAGDCTIVASSNGLPSVARTFAVTKVPQSITFPNVATANLADGSTTLSATSDSGLPVSYTSSNNDICTVDGSTVTYIAVGRCELVAEQDGDDTYLPATSFTRFFDILEKPSVTDLVVHGGADEGSRLTYDASIGGSPEITETYQWYRCASAVSAGASVPGDCSPITGATKDHYVTGVADIDKFVTVLVTATNAVGSDQAIAARADKVNALEIFFPNPEDQFVDATGTTVTASATGDAPVSFTSNTPSVCTVSSAIGTAVMTYLKSGTCSVTASSGSIPSVTRTFEVNKVGQEIAFPDLTLAALATGTKSLDATSSSGLPVSYASTDTSVCTVAGSTVTFVAIGMCEIVADQAGDDSYLAADSVTRRFFILNDPGITDHVLIGLAEVASILTYDATFVRDDYTDISHQWYRCKTDVPATTTVPDDCVAINGATDTIYHPVSADVGKFVTVFITARNPVGLATSMAPVSTAVTKSTTLVSKKLKTTVYFASLSPTLDYRARANLNSLVRKLPAQATNIEILIHGFVQPTSATGNDFSLSRNRANNVTAYLGTRGLSGKHVVVARGRAKEKGARARRVEVTLTYTIPR